MRKAVSCVVLVMFLVLTLAAVFIVQGGIDKMKAGKVEELGFLPKGEYLQRISLGYDHLLADLIWLKTIQVMGEKKIPPQNAKWIYNALDAATDLDNRFEYVYEAGGVFLSAICSDYEASNRILKKGFYNNPNYWRLPFYIGVNYLLYLDNYEQAAYYMGQAAVLPGRPEFVPLLATRLYAEAGDPRFAIELLENVYRSTKDERVKASLQERIKELMIEVNLRQIEEASEKYEKIHHEPPGSIETLVREGYLGAIPKDALNGRYFIDPLTGEIKNDKLPRRLKVFRKGEK